VWREDVLVLDTYVYLSVDERGVCQVRIESRPSRGVRGLTNRVDYYIAGDCDEIARRVASRGRISAVGGE
jgi:hypothetical protein